ncbi:MAG: hypothetical protein E4H01_08970 [Lysobacterales bacterium]|nr:MAG: hypothetical protein E4H01_08970 [Xanthomonadales bacterium]
MTADAVAARLQVQPQAGLGLAEVNMRRARYGANRLPEAPPRSAWLVFFSQFKGILILILIGAALLAALIGNVKDALVILAVVIINALVGFYQDRPTISRIPGECEGPHTSIRVPGVEISTRCRDGHKGRQGADREGIYVSP